MLSWTIGLFLLTIAIVAGFFLLILAMPVVFNNLISDPNLLEKLFLKKGTENFYFALIKIKDVIMSNILIYVLVGVTMIFLVILGLIVILQWRYQEHSKKIFYTIFALSGLIFTMLTTIIILSGVWWFSFVALSLAMGVFFIQNAILKKMADIDRIDNFNDENDFGADKIAPLLKDQFSANSQVDLSLKNNIKVQQLEPLTKEEIHTDINYSQESEDLDFDLKIEKNKMLNLQIDSKVPDLLNPNLLKENVSGISDYEKNNSLNPNSSQLLNKNFKNNYQTNEVKAANNLQPLVEQQPMINSYSDMKQQQFKPQRETVSYSEIQRNNGSAFNNAELQNHNLENNRQINGTPPAPVNSYDNFKNDLQKQFKPQRETVSYAESLKINAAAFNNAGLQNHNLENNRQINGTPPAPVNSYDNFRNDLQQQPVVNSYSDMKQPWYTNQQQPSSYSEIQRNNGSAFNNAGLQNHNLENNRQINGTPPAPVNSYDNFRNDLQQQPVFKAEVRNGPQNYPKNNLVYGTNRIVDKKDLPNFNGSLLNKALEKKFEFDSQEELIDPNKVYYHSPSTGKTIEINHKETQDLLFSDFSEKPQELENPIYEYVPVTEEKKDNSKKIEKKISTKDYNNYQEKSNSEKDIEHYHSQYPNYSFANDNCPICFGN